jgi:PadR family transcriptional regulator, regulatory protein AphA
MLKYAILGFLRYAPMTGYEIKQRIDSSTSHFWHAKLSQIYVTLKGLEAEGQVVSTLQTQPERPDRRIYALTEAGQSDLQAWLMEPYTELSPKKETLILKMFFSAHLDRQIVLAQLQLQLDLHQKQLTYYREEALKKIHSAAEELPALEADAAMWEATRRFGEMYEAVYVRWIEEMLAEVRQK